MTSDYMVDMVRESAEMASYPGTSVHVSDSVVYDEQLGQRFDVRIITIKSPVDPE